MTKPVKTKATRLLVSLRDDIERLLNALFGELDRLRLEQPAAAPTPAPTRAAPTPALPSTAAVKPSPTLATPPPAGAGRFQTEAQAKSQCPADLVVWANLTSKIYHVAGHKSYGTTKAGAYMCEKEAMAQGFRAAKTHVAERITPRHEHIDGSKKNSPG
jgi:hypothetical protein